MKKLLIVLGLLVLALFVVGCGTGQAVGTGGKVTTILKNEVFSLPDGAGKLHLYQYKGADAPSTSDAKIKLKDIETGESITLDYVYQSYAQGVKGGALFKVGLYQSYAGGVDESKDWYLILKAAQTKSTWGQIDSTLYVCYDSECKTKKDFNSIIAKI